MACGNRFVQLSWNGTRARDEGTGTQRRDIVRLDWAERVIVRLLESGVRRRCRDLTA